jgi:hypothetical protein
MLSTRSGANFMSGLRVLMSAACFVGLAAGSSVTAFAGWLITMEEAALPPQRGAIANEGRGILRGPKITIPEPELDAQLSPIRFLVTFQSYGGSTIHIDALKLTYLKSPLIDLTARVRPFVTASGIDMPGAQVPPGDHLLRIDIKDSEGRVGSRSFLLKIAP